MHVRRLKPFLVLACLIIDFGDPPPGGFSFEAKEWFMDRVVALSKPAPARLARAHQMRLSQDSDEPKTAEAYRAPRSNPVLRPVGQEPERRYSSRSSDPPASAPDASAPIGEVG
jgi:hypothetical protein